MVASTFAVVSSIPSEKALSPSEDKDVSTEVNGAVRKVSYEISRIGCSYLKPTDYSKLGRSDHTQPGINQWYIPRNTNYNDTIVHDSWPYVIASNPYSWTLASQAKYHYLTASWITSSFYQMTVDAQNITGLATGAQKDPCIVPIFHTGTDPDADDGGWVNMSLYQNYLTDREVADIKSGVHYANTFYGVSATEYNNTWRYYANDGWFSEIQGHWDFSRRAAHKFMGLPAVGDLRTEFNSVGAATIAANWRTQWIADGDIGGPQDIYAAYGYSLLTGNGPVSIWVKLDVANSTTDKLALWFWSQTWGGEFLLMRYLEYVGIEKNMMPEREEWLINGTFSPLNGDIYERMTSTYHLTAWNDKGAYNNPTWMLEPQHADYTAERLTDIYMSHFDPYYWTYYADTWRPTRMCYAPGVSAYGQRVHYWSTPMSWNLTADESLKIKLPSSTQTGWGIEPYWSSNFTLPGLAVAEMQSNGHTGEFVLGHGYPSSLYSTTYYDAATKTITIPGGTTWAVNPNTGGYPSILESGSPLFYFDISPVSHYGLTIHEPGPYVAGVTYNITVTPLDINNNYARCNQTVQLPAVAGVNYGATSHTFSWNEVTWSTPVTFTGGSGNYTLISQDAYFYLDISDSFNIYVGGGPPINMPPTIDIAGQFTVVKRTTNTYTATASDPENDPLMFTWSWGDGKSSVTYTSSATHSYAKVGTYTLTVSADDQTGIAGHIVYDVAIVNVVSSLPPPPATVSLGIVGLPSTLNVNSTADFLLQALDINGAVSTSYTGAVVFRSTDPEAILPFNYTFTTADAGQHWFYGQTAFMTPGAQMLSAQDINNPAISGNATVNVVDSRVTLLNEHFDSWATLEKHWTVWNCTNPAYNSIDVANGTLRMTNLAAYPINDSKNAMANWTYPMTYSPNLTISFRIYLPLNDYYKTGIYGQFIAITLYDSSGVQRLFARFLMDSAGSVPNGFAYINQYGTWGNKIASFNAGWHNVSISLLQGASTWVATFDGAVYSNLTYTGSAWSASDLSKIIIFNALREEPVVSMIDDFKVERVGPPAPPPAQNTPPVASFAVSPSIGNADTYFLFNANLSYDKEDQLSALKFRWDWQGDGVWDTAWSSSQYQTHSFHAGGTFKVVLQVMDTGGLTGMTNRTVFVDATPPFAFAGLDRVAYNGVGCVLSAAGSFDAETSIIDYAWTYSDYYGTHILHGDFVVVTVLYPPQQSVPVTLTVTDAAGNSASDVCILTVWPDRVSVLKYSGQNSKVFTSYRLVAPDNGDLTIYIENEGLRSVDVRVMETDGVNYSFPYSGTIKFQSYGAYPNGTVYLPTLQMKRGYEYQVDVWPFGSAGNYAYFGNLFVSSNQAPTPRMSIVQNNMTVDLNAAASSDPDGDSMRFVWEFGDGTMSYGASVTHTYSIAASYVVTLKVYDSAGMTSSTSQVVKVPPIVNLPPVPVITVVSISGLTVSVDGSNSYDPDGTISQYSWTWWDGTPPTLPSPIPTASHTYAAAGTYTIRLQVWDNLYLDATVFMSVTVGTAPPPAGNWSSPVTVDSGTASQIGSSASMDANYDGDAMAAWTEQNGGQWNVWANRYVLGSGWQGAELIGTAAAYTNRVCVRYDDTYGNVTVAWIRDSSIVSARYVSDIGWQAPVVISSTQNNALQLSMGAGGHMAVLAWTAYDGTAYRAFATVRNWQGVWSSPVALVAPGSYADSPSAAMPESGGEAVVSFTTSSGTSRDLYVSSYDYMSGLWDAPVLAEDLPGYAYSSKAAMDTYGNIFVVWVHQLPTQSNESTYGNLFKYGLGWGTATRIEPSTSGRCNEPQISTYGNSNAVVSWSLSGWSTQGFTPSEIRSCRYIGGTGWSAPVTISSNITNAWRTSLDVDWAGNAVLGWSQADGSGNPSGYYIVASTSPVSSGWSAPVKIAWAMNTSGPMVAAAEFARAYIVWDEFGSNENVWASTFVDESALPLIASFTYTLNGSTVNVDGSQSGPASRIVSYTWNWGDGTMPNAMTTPYASHTYGAPRGTIPAPPWGGGTGPPPPPFTILGLTYDLNGTPIYGCNATITNLRTGEYLSAVSDMEYGYYMVDVAYLGWMTGDPIEVTAVSGQMYWSNWTILNLSGAYLQLDVGLRMPGQMILMLTVTDTLGETSWTGEFVTPT